MIKVFVYIVLALSLFSCSKTDTADTTNTVESKCETNSQTIELNNKSKSLADKIIGCFLTDELPESGSDYFFSGADQDGDNYIAGKSLGMIVNGIFAEPDDTDKISDYAFFVPVGNHIFEIDILCVELESDIRYAESWLEARLNTIDTRNIKFYVPEEEWIYNAAEIIACQNYVILLATPDNQRAEQIIQSQLGSFEVLKAGSYTTIAETIEIIKDTEVETSTTTENIAQQITQVSNTTSVSVEISEITEDRTAQPIVKVSMNSHNESFAIGGTCEPGAMIRVTGGLNEVYTASDFGEFLVEVDFSGEAILTLTAELPGKLPSEPMTYNVSKTNVYRYEDSGSGIIIGNNYRVFINAYLPDYIGSNLIDEAAVEELAQRTAKKASSLAFAGSEAELVYVIVPDPMNIYPEDVPEKYAKNTGVSLKDQFIIGVTKGGAHVIDLLDIMTANKYGEYKIYNKTDSHWTEYGAMLGYEAIADYLAQNYPDAAPRQRSSFSFYKKRVNFGDIYYPLSLARDKLKETSAFVKFNFDCQYTNLYDNDGDSVLLVHDRISSPQESENNQDGVFPRAYIFRDSFAGPLHAFLADRLSYAYWHQMWDFKFNAAKIAKYNPDYIIYIINERDIGSVIYN